MITVNNFYNMNEEQAAQARAEAFKQFHKDAVKAIWIKLGTAVAVALVTSIIKKKTNI